MIKNRMTKTSKANLLAADRLELDFNSIFQSWHILAFKGDKMAYVSDSEGAINYESIFHARQIIKRVRPDLEPTSFQTK